MSSLRWLGFAAAATVASAVTYAGCSKKVQPAVARQITSRSDLIGGPGALGEVGDYLLANDQVRVIIQGGGYSRGFGIYGGGLIDADLQRPEATGDSGGGHGYDNFSELFPAVFLRGMAPRDNGFKVATNEEDGSATVTVNGAPADFLFIAHRLNQLIVQGDLLLENEYKLRPGKRYVEITTRVINQGTSEVELPGEGIDQFVMADDFPLPVGDVILFGAGNDVFTPKAGFDLRFTLAELYKDPPPLPALPGLATPFIATRGHKVSYGFMSGITEENLSYPARAKLEGARPDDILVPFIFSAFTGSFYGAAPKVLAPKEEFAYTKYFIIGRGDAAAIRDVYHELRGIKTGAFSGIVREERTRAIEAGADVITFDANGHAYNHHTADENGQFRGTYEPGKYTYVVTADGRHPSAPVAFEVKEGQTTPVEIGLASAGLVGVQVVAEDGRPLPAKCSIVGVHGHPGSGARPQDFLFDFKLGEGVRPTDYIPDTSDPRSREFVEEIILAPLGMKTEKVRPGKYRIVCSRGIEYDTAEREIEVKPGMLTPVSGVLRRVLNTSGWASGDYHLHSDNSVDSDMDLEERVTQVAAEGVDIACSSDHNFVTDFTPYLSRLGLDPWTQGMVGLELTTLEIGHFNGFPLRYDPGPITKGSFRWDGRKPAELFKDLRELGSFGPENTIVQVNHPRDTILGYFNDYNFNPDNGMAEKDDGVFLVPERDDPLTDEFGHENFDLGFDAIEVFNGKRFELLHTYRVPDELPPGPLPELIPPAGEILRDEGGKIAYPGVVEDWFVLLNQGHKFTATGNSDSHELHEEPGYPRTYVPVSNDNPGQIDAREIVAALKTQKALVTNGPFITVRVNGDKGMGEIADGRDGDADVEAAIQAAPWVQINEVNLIVNGEVRKTWIGNNASLAKITEKVTTPRDAFIIIEVKGDQSMWPVVVPLEIPSLQVSDALGSLAGGFGVNLAPFGALQPKRESVVYPYAFTNPVYVDADGDGKFQGPGVSRQELVSASETAPRASAKKLSTRAMPALVRLFATFAAHDH